MNIFFLTIYFMLWVLGVCASYAFVMMVTRKDASLPFLRTSSLLALVSYGVSWFFGVLYYTHPDTIARFARAVTPSSNAWMYTLFTQSRECIFLSFVLVPALAILLAVMIGTGDFAKKKNNMVTLSIVLAILGVLALLLAMMIV